MDLQLSYATIDCGLEKNIFWNWQRLLFLDTRIHKHFRDISKLQVRQPSCSVDLKPIIHASCQTVVGIQLSFSSRHLSQCSSLVTTLIVNPLAFFGGKRVFYEKTKSLNLVTPRSFTVLRFLSKYFYCGESLRRMRKAFVHFLSSSRFPESHLFPLSFFCCLSSSRTRIVLDLFMFVSYVISVLFIRLYFFLFFFFLYFSFENALTGMIVANER